MKNYLFNCMVLRKTSIRLVAFCFIHTAQGESKQPDSFEMQIIHTKSHWYKTYQISAVLIELKQKSDSLWNIKSF